MIADEFGDGYTLGYATGHDLGWHRGYGDSEREMAAAWHAAAHKIRAVLQQPSRAEVERERSAAGRCRSTGCRGRCSRCIRADWVNRHGERWTGGRVASW